MESITIKFTANGQQLTGGGLHCASNTVHYIIADFDLGDNWQGYDSVRAVWSNDFKCISTVLDPSGSCTVPHEVLERRGKVSVNLVGSILEDDELTDRLTTYPIVAITVDANAKICGTETAEVTPSQFEQYVAIVIAEVEKVTGMTAVAYALPEGSAPTANYSGGVLTLGIPKGDTGATGNGISSVEFNEDYSLTFYFTDSEPFTTPSIRGAQGARGYGIASVEKIGSVGLVDTYRINFEDPSVPATTFTVTNGEEGPQGPRGYTGETGNGIDRIELTDTQGAVKTYTIYFTDPNVEPYEYQVTDGQVTLAQLSAVLPTDTASGAIASFEDGSGLFDYLSCVVNIEPAQAGSGTPSPDNVRPITGWTGCEVDVAGVNLFDKSTSLDGYIENTDGVYHAAVGYKCTDYIKINGGDSYYIVSEQTAAKCGAWYDKDKAYISGITGYGGNALTAPNNAMYMRLTIANNATGDVDTFAVNTPSTDHDYHAYNGTTYPVSWQTEAGTVYGGTVDLVTGVLTVTMADINLGSLPWSYNSSNNRFQSAVNSAVGWPSNVVANAICSQYKTVTFDSLYMGGDGVLAFDATNLRIRDTRYTDPTAFKSAINGVQLVYELATPTTYQLDPVQVACLLGHNNVWADCGDIEEVTYKADVQKWVEKQLREINTAILALS